MVSRKKAATAGHGRIGLRAVAVSLFLSVSLAGCALPPSDPLAREAYKEANDPLEGLNRTVWGLNEAADILFLRPAAQVYREGVPEPVQTVVRNFLRNLSSPLVIANQLLQGDFQGASVATQRMFINTTAGLAGLFDVAAMNGLKYESEDFGQTLAVWGIPEGPYVVLPLFGPSNVRDALGRTVDTLADPFRLYVTHKDHEELILIRGGANALETRAGLLEAVDDQRKNSLDYYATVRSLYRQHRTREISDGNGSHSGSK